MLLPKPLIVLGLALGMVLFAAPADAQMENPAYERVHHKSVGGLVDVPFGAECVASWVNNESMYPPDETTGDRGNLLMLVIGRDGEHDGDWIVQPVERSVGESLNITFKATGGDVFALVAYDIFTSLEDGLFECEVPPTPPPGEPPPEENCPPDALACTGFTTGSEVWKWAAIVIGVGILMVMKGRELALE